MQHMKTMTNQGGQSQGDESKPSSRPPGEKPNPSRTEPEPAKQPTRKEPETSKQPGRPTPSGVPNESQRAEGAYKYKGGRQGTGGVPNPDDQDDRESAGSFRGTAKPINGMDDDDESAGAGEFRRDLISPIRNPE